MITDTAYRSLIEAIVVQAVREAKLRKNGSNPVRYQKAAEARDWLGSEDAQDYCNSLGYDHAKMKNWLSTLEAIPGNNKLDKEKKMSIQEVIQDAIEDAGVSSEVDAVRFREMLMGEVGTATGQVGTANRRALSDEFAGQVAKMRAEGRPQSEIEALHRQYQDRGMGQVAPGGLSINKVTEIAGRVSAQFRAQQYREEMQAAQGNPKKVRQVKETWKARGLDVDHTPLY